MMDPFYLLGGCCVFGIVYKSVATLYVNYVHGKTARELGCKPLPKERTRFFGLDILRREMKADREMYLPSDIMTRFEEVGATTYEYQMLNEKHIATCDPLVIQTVLATQFKEFTFGNRPWGTVLGNGIFTIDNIGDNKEWLHTRAMLKPQFLRNQVSDLELEEGHVRNFMSVLKVGDDGWTPKVNLQHMFFNFTHDSATEFLFGKSADCQLLFAPGGDPKGVSKPLRALLKALDVVKETVNTKWFLGNNGWIADSPTFRKNCAYVNDFMDALIAKTKAELEAKPKGSKPSGGREKYHFLHAMLDETDDKVELRGQALNILLAGRETTASLLGWLWYYLARHPIEFQKLRAAVLKDFGTAENPKPMSFESLKACDQLQYCNNEILRLFPLISYNSRMALTDTTLPRGGGPDGNSPIFVKKGQQIVYHPHAMHRRKDIWGQDADEFRPDRWKTLRPGWEYIPFNGGGRICMGQQFALTEASYLTVRLLQRFDRIENLDPNPVLKQKVRIVNTPGEGVLVRLHEAAAGA
uniref:Putative THF-degrading cytochrome P450 monooxygenase n=1 Tax=Scedosporium sp. TaxID=1861771 RepID=A0A4Y5QZR4_9PEZI|nr:putative THF-degrading cytochrome P450 monooxygenase [Scedosporium sp.]